MRASQAIHARRFVVFIAFVACAPTILAQGLKNVIPANQKPLLQLFPPTADQQTKPDVGKFVIFTREPVGKDWDYIAGAWECIPSQPETAITKRVEFCHSSWNADRLLDTLVRDKSTGLHPRFVRLQVNHEQKRYTVNIYDINYRTWDVRRIWQGDQFTAFGVLDHAIICETSDGWMRLNTASGKLTKDVPFEPLWVDGEHWMVRKPDDPTGCWSYNRKQLKYIARFDSVDRRAWAFSDPELSTDGESLAWVLLNWPNFDKWRGGLLPGKMLLQRKDRKEDISIPIEIWAAAGSGIPVIPKIFQFEFGKNSTLRMCARIDDNNSKAKHWEIDVATGRATDNIKQHVQQKDIPRHVSGVPVPEYLRNEIEEVAYFGPSGIAAAFMKHLGIVKTLPQYDECRTGVSKDGRHVLYKALKGPLEGHFYYGDLKTKQTNRWQSPKELTDCNSMDIVWVETP